MGTRFHLLLTLLTPGLPWWRAAHSEPPARPLLSVLQELRSWCQADLGPQASCARGTLEP